MTTTPRRLRLLAVVMAAVALGEVVLACALAPIAGMSWREAVDAFLVSNALMGASFTLGGLLIAWHRPTNAVGLLLIADGLGHATSAGLVPVVLLLQDQPGNPTWARSLFTVMSLSWPWSIALFLPMALLLFPDGKLPSRGWRPIALAVVVTAPLFVVEMAGAHQPFGAGLGASYLSGSWYADLSALWAVSNLRVLAAIVVGLVALGVRYRRGTEIERRQLLWLLLASIIVICAVTPWALVSGTPIVVLFAIPLVPAAIAIAVVRHQLLDIRLVVSRALAWTGLSVAVFVAYLALIAVLDLFVSSAVGPSAYVTVLVAVSLAPLLPRLQREVDRWMYGDRNDPARVASRLGEHLATGDARDLQDVMVALRSALRVPWASITADGAELAADGAAPVERASVPLRYGGEEIGSLMIGLRRGERTLGEADAITLQLVAAPLAVAVRALALSADLQVSRTRIVAAREEERRRLRRDLHDGLGPTLTGVGLAADAAANLFHSDPVQSQHLLSGLRTDTRNAILDVRRLVDDLRPAALDEIGLAGALQQSAEQLRRRPDGRIVDVRMTLPEDLPPLPAAVEVAAYRIATEALTNIARHTDATTALVAIRCDRSLHLEVTDNGNGQTPWSPGVGLGSMRERAAEVGGTFDAGPSDAGGRVAVSLPLAATPLVAP